MTEETSASDILELAAELTAAWLANPNTKITAEELPGVIGTIHSALAGLASPQPEVAAELEYTPAVTVRRSLASPDHLISLIDGKPYKMLKRHLGQHGLTPAQYRERYGLKADYPMVAETYSLKRRDLAKQIGLGRKRGSKVDNAKSAPEAAAAKPAAKPKAPRKPKASARLTPVYGE